MEEKELKKYDAVIIGTGQAGKPLAKKLSKEGWKIAVIEKDKSGGSCINYGCTPTKAMISSAEVSWIVKNSYNWGLNISGNAVDFDQVIQRRDQIVEQFRHQIDKDLLDNQKVDFFRGTASLASEKKVIVRYDNEKPDDHLEADKIFINTGTVPELPKIKGLKDVPFYTAKNWMDIQKLPEHLVIIGGGNIGVEFAQMFCRLGSKVTVIQEMDQLIPREDEDIAGELLEIFWSEGIDVHLNTRVDSVAVKDEHFVEVKYSEAPMKRSILATHIIIATGTLGATSELNLKKAGIEYNEKGYISVDQRLETNVPGVYALGDCKGGPEFTHVSYDDYRIIADQFFGDKKRQNLNRRVSYTLFTDPQLGRFGLNEKQCRARGIPYRTALMKAKNIARAIETNRTKGFMKVLIGDDDRLIGGSVLLSEGGEIASLLQVAMMGGLKYQDLRDSIFAHPTYAESINSLFKDIRRPEDM